MMVKVIDFVPDCPVSVPLKQLNALSVTVVLLCAVGVPEMMPVAGARDRPAGNVPTEMV